MRNSILFVLVVASLESGCGAKLPSVKPFKMEVQQGNVVTSKMLLQLRPGMTRSQVRYIMGTPLIVDSFRDNRWDYFYELRKEGKIIEKRKVILDFEKDSLVSVRGDVVPSAENADVKTIAEAPQKKVVDEKDQSWSDKLKFWKSDEAASASVESNSAAKAADSAQISSAAANAKDHHVADKEMAAQVANTVEPPPVFESESAKITASKQGGQTSVAEDDEVVPFIPEGEYVAPVAPSEKEMVKGNMAEANVPATDAEAHQVTEKGVAPKESHAVEPPPTFVAEKLPEPEPEPVLPPPISALAPAVAASAAGELVEPKEKETSSFAQKPPAGNEEIDQAVAAWAQSWRSKDIKSYLACYASDFVPDTLSSRKAWEIQRKQRLSNAGEITLVLSNVEIQREGDSAVATVRFEQRYAARSYKDELVKTLELRYDPTPKRWLITREHVAPLKSAGLAAPEVSDNSLAETPATTQASVTSELSVESAVDAWAKAWRSKNISAYFAAYSPKFVPEGLPSRSAWESQRRKRLSPQQGKISLDISNVNVTRAGDVAVVTFSQKYASKSYRDEMFKRLELQLDSSTQRWLIVRESTASGSESASTSQVTAPEGGADHLDGVLEQIGF